MPKIAKHEDLGLVDGLWTSRWTLDNGKVITTTVREEVVTAASDPETTRIGFAREDLKGHALDLDDFLTRFFAEQRKSNVPR
jgi:hypothetical protein